MLHSRQEMQDVDDARMCAVDENTLIVRPRALGRSVDLRDWISNNTALGGEGERALSNQRGRTRNGRYHRARNALPLVAWLLLGFFSMPRAALLPMPALQVSSRSER